MLPGGWTFLEFVAPHEARTAQRSTYIQSRYLVCTLAVSVTIAAFGELEVELPTLPLSVGTALSPAPRLRTRLERVCDFQFHLTSRQVRSTFSRSLLHGKVLLVKLPSSQGNYYVPPVSS